MAGVSSTLYETYGPAQPIQIERIWAPGTDWRGQYGLFLRGPKRTERRSVPT
jgi:hypothetical protein